MPGKLSPPHLKRKRERLKLLPRTQAYPINPMRQHEKDCEMVLRAVAKFIRSRGFCPSTRTLSRRHVWNEEAARKYLEDLHEDGYLEVHFGTIWNPTKKGWGAIGVDPIEPMVPYEMGLKAASIAQMRTLLRRVGNEKLFAEYDEFAKDRRENVHSPYDF